MRFADIAVNVNIQIPALIKIRLEKVLMFLSVGKFERFAMPHATQSVRRVDLSYFVGEFCVILELLQR